MFLNEGEKENFLIAERVLESSKKKKKREREKEREPEKERENGAPGMFWRRKKRIIKEGGRDSGGHVCGGEKQEKKKEKWMKRMAESEMKKGKII